jgi:pimeloyl-ACP methyl ester carboxylesterase
MAKRTQKQRRQPLPELEVVDPRWLLKASAAVVALAVVCAYLSVCALFWYGQWQLVLHPVRTSSVSPASFGLTAEPVSFGDVRGWWFAPPTAGAPTVLMLPGGDASAAALLGRVRTLQEAGTGVLLFDYRGFGPSGSQHPTEKTMEGDSESALAFLTGPRDVPPRSVVVFGEGLGASLAVRLCAEHTELPALILEAPGGDFHETARSDSRARLVPFDMLFDEDFPLAGPLHTLATPKLLISYTTGPPPPVVQQAAVPKVMLEVPSGSDDAAIATAVRRFLGENLR